VGEPSRAAAQASSGADASHVGPARRIRSGGERRRGESSGEPATSASHVGPARGTRGGAARRPAVRAAAPGLGECADAATERASHLGPERGTRDDAVRGLTGLGWPRGVAVTSVDAAIAALGEGSPLADLVREALRRCPLARG
jgi:hypothetical protein